MENIKETVAIEDWIYKKIKTRMQNLHEPCQHNQRCRYEHGFYCEDCKTFFGKDSSTYRKGELLFSIWMVLNNINVDEYRAGRKPIIEVENIQEKIGINKQHENYEELITEAEIILAKYNKTSDSASIIIS